MARLSDRTTALNTGSNCDIPGWEKSEVLLRDLGADDVVIATVNRNIDESEVQGRITRLRSFAQENPMVLLGALSALMVGGAVAVGRKKVASRKRAAARSSSTKRAAAKRTTSKRAAPKRAASSKRTMIEPHTGDKRFIRRDAKGRIKESVDVGRSLAADSRRKAKTRSKAGSGDKGDR